MATQGGPAMNVVVDTSPGAQVEGGSAIPVAVVTGRAVTGNKATRVVVVSNPDRIEGGPTIPVVAAPAGDPVEGGPAMRVYVVSGVLGASAPVNTALPTITGTLAPGQTLTATTGTWTNSPTSYSYQWYRGGVAIGGATNSTYVTTIADAGAVITVVVTATSAGGSASATSAGATIFTPSGVSGLQVWYKADTLVLANGAAVPSWSDSSGNNNTATQADATRQPTYQTNQTPNGTKPIVRAAAGGDNDDRMDLTSGVALTGDFTVFWCWKVTDLSANRAYCGNTATGTQIAQQTTTTMRVRDDASTTLTITHAAINTTSFYRVVLVRSGNTVTRYVNGSSDGSGVLSTSTATINRIFIQSNTVSPMQGDCAEFGIYNVALNAGQIAQLDSYLNARFF